jgi:hypothetical protein
MPKGKKKVTFEGAFKRIIAGVALVQGTVGIHPLSAPRPGLRHQRVQSGIFQYFPVFLEVA